jgi:hypothetical protein
MKILRFDCAHKSLGVFYGDITITLTDLESLGDLCVLNMDENNVTTVDDLTTVGWDMLDKINIKYLKTINLLGNRRVKDVHVTERVCLLNQYLKELDEELQLKYNIPDYILIEYQMGPNDKTRGIVTQLISHYISPLQFMEGELDNNEPFPIVATVGPSLKNTIQFAKHLKLSEFMLKYLDNYRANKAHSRANLEYLLKVTDREHFLKGVKKGNYDDLGDALLQAIAYKIKKIDKIN